MTPLISVVVPVYNGGAYLDGCLNSIRASVQQLPESDRDLIELVICDNHSTDDSLNTARAAEVGCRTEVVQPPQHEENRTRNWSFAMDAAQGEWLMMLHADDLMTPGSLRAQLALVRHGVRPNIVMISGRHRTFEHDGEEGVLHPKVAVGGVLSGGWLARSVLPLHCPFVPFTMLKRSAYEQVGGFDDTWQLVQDWVLWLKLTQVGDVLSHTDDVGMWRIHPTSPGYRRLNAEEHLRLADRLREVVPKVPRAIQAQARSGARARAAIQLAEAPEVARELQLPDADRAQRVMRRMRLLVSAQLYGLRMAGLVRGRAGA